MHQHSGERHVPVDSHGDLLPVGHYEDTFRKVDGRWLLATRTTFLAFAGPTERLGSADKA
ncbi:hypothetical protein GCM10010507_12710 [Streptomyces cinnamoneus]|uniref:SnoaL-like domain-containing protein n=1 Tax=Streptomyces cinnamoneus TaxID=53446 RepID=A0A918TD27_STRCJ|nr:hypothetical protein GCM10010507_12710 [Streptomyces cinnamoneus]